MSDNPPMPYPACAERRLHTADETAAHHPLAGHGYAPESGWTHPDLAPKPQAKGENHAHH